ILLGVLAVQPEARTPEPKSTYVFPLSSEAQLALEGCASVAAREEFEASDCLQATRLQLIEGKIDLMRALRALEECAALRSDLQDLGRRRAELRADLYAARMAFGETLERAEVDEYRALLQELGRSHREIPGASVDRLRQHGISPSGILASNPEAVLARLERDGSLRAAFRDVFGQHLASDLQ